jgi:hypothetical protein
MAIDVEKPSRKKPFFTVSKGLRAYLKKHGREAALPLAYDDLLHMSFSVPLTDKAGKDTYWEKAIYDMREWNFLRPALINLYATLRTEGDFSYTKHLDVARVDYCTFGNSNPFRVRIVNRYNDNYDHFYLKKEDASRIYGLELEHILSPNRITYLTSPGSIVEEHIAGIPGDVFIQQYLFAPETNRIRFAKEFVKFNERCFVRLLGDMRSYNFVVDITPDIEDFQYRIRAIDFDQQSYEGRKSLYLPQFFKENRPLVELAGKLLNQESINQYQAEERTMMAFRLASDKYRIKDLLDTMQEDEISTNQKIQELATALNEHFDTQQFRPNGSMGQLVKSHLKQTLRKELLHVPKMNSRTGGG